MLKLKQLTVDKPNTMKPYVEKIIPCVGKWYTIGKYDLYDNLVGKSVKVLSVNLFKSDNLLVEAFVEDMEGNQYMLPTNTTQSFFSATPTPQPKQEDKKYRVTTITDNKVTIVEEM